MSMRSVSVFLAAATSATADQVSTAKVNSVADQSQSKPNIVYFLTDDQDQKQGSSFPLLDQFNGATPMPQTQALFAAKGKTALNMYIHTPVCNPSRAELLSGRYFHNIVKPKGPQQGMGADSWYANSHNFANILKEKAGYTTGLFGKYMNSYQEPPFTGWDVYIEIVDYFGRGKGRSYATAGLQEIDPDYPAEGHVHVAEDTYVTSLLGNLSAKWITSVAKKQAAGGSEEAPFFAYIAPHAPHAPFTPAKWYENYTGPSRGDGPVWPIGPPKEKNFNTSNEQRQYHFDYIATNPTYIQRDVETMNLHFLKRWRTLLSVDDVIGQHIRMIEDLGLDNSTYFLYTSDHGYNQGELQLIDQKHNHYEFDTKIHLLVRGPGVTPGSTFSQPTTQVDLAPTFLGLAGLDKADFHDGKSIVPMLVTDTSASAGVPASVKQHLASLGGSLPDYLTNWRKAVYHMYLYHECPADTFQKEDNGYQGILSSSKNNFIGVRYFDGAGNLSHLKYTELYEGDILKENVSATMVNPENVFWTELFNLTADPWELENLSPDHHGSMSQDIFSQLKKGLRQFFGCRADACP